MNDEAGYNHEEITRFVLLLRTEHDVVKKQKYLDDIDHANSEIIRINSQIPPQSKGKSAQTCFERD